MRSSIVALVLVLGFALPFSAQAAELTQDQINSIVNLLQSFNAETKTVETVRAVLNKQTPPMREGNAMATGQMAKMRCLALKRNLNVGSQGTDVAELQKFLKERPEAGFTASSTGYYGMKTAEAMRRFQVANGIASTTSGNVGPMTRGFIERHCGVGLLKNRAEQ